MRRRAGVKKYGAGIARDAGEPWPCIERGVPRLIAFPHPAKAARTGNRKSTLTSANDMVGVTSNQMSSASARTTTVRLRPIICMVR